ncbi:MAG: YraN family protein [Eubacteriales bacterium]
MMTANNNRAEGRFGEGVAADWLIAHGYVILARNFTAAHGELDIVAQRSDGALAVVEVKSRGEVSAAYARGASAVNSRKRAAIISAAREYIEKNGLHGRRVSYDVAEIVISAAPDGGRAASVNYIAAAFSPPSFTERSGRGRYN